MEELRTAAAPASIGPFAQDVEDWDRVCTSGRSGVDVAERPIDAGVEIATGGKAGP